MNTSEKERYRARLARELEVAELEIDLASRLTAGISGLAAKWGKKKCNARFFKALDTELGGTPKWIQWSGGHWAYESFFVKWCSYEPLMLEFTPRIPNGSRLTYNDLGSIHVPLAEDDRIDPEEMLKALASRLDYWTGRKAKIEGDLAAFDALFDELKGLMVSVREFRDAHADFFHAVDGTANWGYLP